MSHLHLKLVYILFIVIGMVNKQQKFQTNT